MQADAGNAMSMEGGEPLAQSIAGWIATARRRLRPMLFTFAGLGGIIGPWLVGVVSDLGGSIQIGFSLNLIFGLLTAASALVLMRRTKARG